MTTPCAAVVHFGDLFSLNPITKTWTALPGFTTCWGMGFAASPNGLLYLFGGYNGGNIGAVWVKVRDSYTLFR
jgi:hypothetical protein